MTSRRRFLQALGVALGLTTLGCPGKVGTFGQAAEGAQATPWWEQPSTFPFWQSRWTNHEEHLRAHQELAAAIRRVYGRCSADDL